MHSRAFIILGLLLLPSEVHSPSFGSTQDEELDSLYEKAKRGSDEAVRRIGATSTTKATELLLALTDTSDARRQHVVLPGLVKRLPSPVYADRPCPFPDLRTKEREQLSALAWDVKYNIEARDLAKWLLRHDDVDLAGYGATIITCVGDLADTPAVTEAMTRILDKTKDPKTKPGYMPRSFDPFLMASQGQTYRGAANFENPMTSGEIVVFVNKLATHPTWRPKGWQSKCQEWCDHPVPYIRHIARLRLEAK